MVSVLTFSSDGECVDFFHHVMKELTFHYIVKVQSLCFISLKSNVYNMI